MLEFLLELLARRQIVRMIGRPNLKLAVEDGVDVALGRATPEHLGGVSGQLDEGRYDALVQWQIGHALNSTAPP